MRTRSRISAPCKPIPPDVLAEMEREQMVREAIANTCRHAAAR